MIRNAIALSLCAVILVAVFAIADRAAAAGLSGVRGGSFKVVKPPPRGARKRITIHGAKRSRPPAARRSARHGWFWEIADDDIGSAEAGRETALAKSASDRLTGEAVRNRIKSIRAAFGAEIDAAAAKAGVSAALLTAVVAAESGGDPKAVSRAGAQGLAQLMPATAKRFDVSDPFDPAQNLRGSATYLDVLLDLFENDALLALAGYNAGENAVIRNDGVPPFAETRDYVPIVLSYYDAAKAHCVSPPATVRAPCLARAAEAGG